MDVHYSDVQCGVVSSVSPVVFTEQSLCAVIV